MKKAILILVLTIPSVTLAEGAFTGQKAAACEATLCLASSKGKPGECNDSLKKYFKIVIKDSFGSFNPKKTLEARKDFLKLCPDVDEEVIDSVNTTSRVKEYEDPFDPIDCVDPLTPKKYKQECVGDLK